MVFYPLIDLAPSLAIVSSRWIGMNQTLALTRCSKLNTRHKQLQGTASGSLLETSGRYDRLFAKANIKTDSFSLFSKFSVSGFVVAKEA